MRTRDEAMAIAQRLVELGRVLDAHSQKPVKRLKDDEGAFYTFAPVPERDADEASSEYEYEYEDTTLDEELTDTSELSTTGLFALWCVFVWQSC